MNNRIKILSSVMAVALGVGIVAPQLAYADINDDLGYELVDNPILCSAKDSQGRTWSYCKIKDGTIDIEGTSEVESYLEVPETLDGFKVTVLGKLVYDTTDYRVHSNEVKKRTIVTKVKLPKTIKIIDDGAFSECTNITDIEMPSNVKMSDHVFEDCPGVKVNGVPTSNNSTDISALDLKAGWNNIRNDRYYLNSKGEKQTGWMNLDGKRYYFYGSGQMATAFVNLGSDSVYYLDPTAGANFGNLITGWKYIDGDWYYFNQEAKNGKEKGYMQTGWLYYNGSWYYFYGNGQMATGFINLGNGYYYYLDESGTSSIGIMKTGWQKVGGYWFFFDRGTDGDIQGAMKKGWHYIDGDWYYFYSDGKMAQDTWIDGYYVDSSGAWSR